jgi:hypothetical protein
MTDDLSESHGQNGGEHLFELVSKRMQFNAGDSQDNGDVSEGRPFFVQRLVKCLYDQLRKRLRDDFFKYALLKQIQDDAAARVMVTST